MNCCVFECYATSEKNPELSFFAFPKEEKLNKAWKTRIRRENWEPSKFTTVCSRHFSPSDIRPPNPNTPLKFQKRKLKLNVEPHLNLRGKGIDEREETRTSRTSVKARSTEIESKNAAQLGQPVVPSTAEPKAQHENDAPITSPHDDEVRDLKLQIERLRSKLDLSQKDVSALKQEVKTVSSKLFRHANLSSEQIHSYSSLDTETFDVLSAYLRRFEPINYWSGTAVSSISHDDQLLICLMKLKFNMPLFDLADRYSVSRTTITNIYITYLHLIHEVIFKAIMVNNVPSVEKNRSCLPEAFGDFSNCRIIIDCTEFTVENPRGKLNAASLLFSNYKHNLTAKYLIGVAPNGAVTYVSDGYMGSTSDKIVTDDSGVLNHLKAGDLILADKGFLIHDIMPHGVFLNLPAFLRGKKQFTKAIFSRKIARSRIHVERAIERMRNYAILTKVAAKERWYCDVIVQVCGALVNMQSPLIQGVFEIDSGNKDIDFTIG